MNQPSTSRLRKQKIPQPATARGQRTRQKLLNAAESVFGERGFDGTSIAEITQTAGVALGTFYVYFPHKEAIFVELVDELGVRLRTMTTDAVKGLESRLDIERAGFRAFFQFAAKHRNLYRVVRQAEFVDAAAFKRYYRAIAEGYVRGLESAMRGGQIRRMNPEALAWALMGIADFVGMRFVLWEKSGENLDRILDDIVDFIARGIELAPTKEMSKR